jgi:phosphoglycolate phosphatase-like HAD superfamily hydrolase
MSASASVSAYITLVFDCDGVILDSNKVKTRAFYEAALPYGESAAQAFVTYHTANGGVSRYKKFAYFLEVIVPSLAGSITGPRLEQLLAGYAASVRQGLLTCSVAPGLHVLREATSAARWLIVSGGDQAELREVFAQRELAALFDGGIFGSPDTKDQILSRECGNNNIVQPALFIGDSKYDYQAATTAGLDFVFMTEWSEVADYNTWCGAHNITTLRSIVELLRLQTDKLFT